MRKLLLSLFLLFSLYVPIVSAQQIVGGEYYIDQDPGTGNGFPLTLSPGEQVVQSVSASLAGLSIPTGYHRIHLRLVDENGLWSHTQSQALFVASFDPGDINASIGQGEFFIDEDPGHDQAIPFQFAADNPILITTAYDLSSLGVETGFHRISIRVKDSKGLWSHTQTTALFVASFNTNDALANIGIGEYYIDADPGVGNGFQFSFDPANPVFISTSFSLQGANVSTGFHRLHIRVKDTKGLWSHTETQSIFVSPFDLSAAPSPIGEAEFFVDADPGVGNGIAFSFDPANPVLVVAGRTIEDLQLTAGVHRLGVRVKNQDGVWSHTDMRTIYIDGPANYDNLPIVSGEIFFDDQDAGPGNAPAFALSPAQMVDGQEVGVNLLPFGLDSGHHELTVRVRDAAGVFSHNLTDTFNINQLASTQIAVTSPNGAEVFYTGNTHLIEWASAPVLASDTIILEYSLNNGNTWNLIASDPQNLGSYLWTLPANLSESTLAKVRVSVQRDPGIVDESDNVFSIASSGIYLTSFNAGGEVYAWEEPLITWSSVGLPDTASVEISLSAKAGTFNRILDTISNTGSYSWLVADDLPFAADYRITIRTLYRNLSYTSASSFAVNQPYLTVQSPQTGENYVAGEVLPIRWTDRAVPDTVQLSVQLSADGGANWQELAQVSNNGTYDYTIPANMAASTQVRLRLQPVQYNALGFTTGQFNISNNDLQLTAPLANAILYSGQSIAINWTSSLLPASDQVSLSYKYTSSASWQNIATVGNSGSYQWTVPAGGGSGTVQLRIAETGANAALNKDEVQVELRDLSNLVQSPNTAVTLYAGTDADIVWQSGVLPSGTVLIAYSLDLGATWTPLGSTPDDGSYTWAIPQNFPVSTQALIRIQDAGTSTLQDVSNVPFSIRQPQLSLSYPVGAEVLYTGRDYTITWIASGLPAGAALQVEYTDNGGTTWQLLSDVVPAAAQSLTWSLPVSQPLSESVKVRISYTALSLVTESGLLAIRKPSLLVTYPNGGESLYKGFPANLRWTSAGLSPANTLTLRVSADNGTNWTTIASGEQNDGLYVWEPPFGYPNGSAYLLRVINEQDPGIFDESNAAFVLAEPSLTVNFPAAGDILFGGQSYQINWNSFGLEPTENVRLEYSSDAGNTYSTIKASTPNDGNYLFALPMTAGVLGDARIRISVVSSPAINAVSAAFEVVPPTLSLLVPNGGQQWVPGQQQSLSWDAVGFGALARVILAWSSDNGNTYTNIDTVLARDEAYLWGIPESLVPGDAYRIIVAAYDNQGINAQSASTFSISAEKQGNRISNPIAISFPLQRNDTTSLYSATYTGPNSRYTHDVWYQFTVPVCADALNFEVLTAATQVCFHILDNSGQWVAGQCGNIKTFVESDLIVGESYYLVVQANVNNMAYQLRADFTEHSPQLPESVEACAGIPTTLDAGIDGDSYLWSTGATTRSISVSAEGQYWVGVTKNACTKYDTTTLYFNQEVVGAFNTLLPANATLNRDVPLSFSWETAANASSYDLYLWQQGQAEPAVPTVSGITAQGYVINEGLAFGKTYNWRVVARGVCDSTVSNVSVFSMRNLPDLLSSVTSLPDTVEAGEPLQLKWSIRNESTVSTGTSGWKDYIYLSSTKTTSIDNALLVGSVSNLNYLNANSNYIADKALATSNSIIPGVYYVIVRPSGLRELSTENNASVSAVPLYISAPTLADLEPQSLAYAGTATSGEQLTVSYTVKNTGDRDLNTIYHDNIYLSPFPDYASGQLTSVASARIYKTRNSISGIVLPEPEEYNDLPAGNDTTVSVSVSLPAGLEGTYYLHVRNDVFNKVAEKSESNNILSGSAIQLNLSPAPDLSPVSLLHPATIEAAQFMNISWAVQNLEDGVPPANVSWVDRIYLSETASFDPQTAQLIGIYQAPNSLVNPLARDSSYTQTRPVYIPQTLEGFYYVIVQVNPEETLPEYRGNYANNIYVSSSPVQVMAAQSPDTTVPCDNFASACDLNADDPFGYGIFPMLFDLTNATREPGEEFDQDIHESHDKSVWYRFTIASSRYVEVRIPEDQNKDHLGATDIGLTVFREPQSSYPILGDIGQTDNDLADFTQLNNFGSSGNFCLESGTYYVRFSAGNYQQFLPVSAQLIIRSPSESPSATYLFDRPDLAHVFPDPLGHVTRSVNIDVGCLSIDAADEVLPVLGANYADWSQTAWVSFRTDEYTDLFRFALNSSPFFGDRKVGMVLYQGQALNGNINQLVPLDTAILEKETIYSQVPWLDYICSVNANTYYTAQFFFHKLESRRFTLSVTDRGIAPALGVNPREPYAQGILASNTYPGEKDIYGVYIIPPGQINPVTNYFGCNAKIIDNVTCDIMPAEGFYEGQEDLDLSQWYTFDIEELSTVFVQNKSVGKKLARIYKGDVSQYCTAGSELSLLEENNGEQWTFELFCLEPGTYSVQLLGGTFPENPFNGSSALGYENTLNVWVQREPICPCNYAKAEDQANDIIQDPEHAFTLSDASRIDRINADINGVLQPLQSGTSYQTVQDIFSCTATVLPVGELCNQSNFGAIYRTFRVAADGILYISGGSLAFETRLYRGDASELAQGFAYTDRIVFDQDLTGSCDNYNNFMYCLDSGTYTLVELGGAGSDGIASQPILRFEGVNSQFVSPQTAEDMGDITQSLLAGQTVTGTETIISCESHQFVLDGEVPCDTLYDKMFFREFYIAEPMGLKITGNTIRGHSIYPAIQVYSGKASLSADSLRKVPGEQTFDNSARCRTGSYYTAAEWYSNTCKLLQPGWYTVVYMAAGGSYDGNNEYGYIAGHAGSPNNVTISKISGDFISKHNRPAQASYEGIVKWDRDVYTSGTFPITRKNYTFEREYLTCINDNTDPVLASYQPFPEDYSRIAYYVFTLTRESFIDFNMGSLSNKGISKELLGEVYSFDVRYDSAFLNPQSPFYRAPLAPMSNRFELNRMQPGTYTLVAYIPEGDIFNALSVAPGISIERVLPSRFDHASAAYDFGNIPGTGMEFLSAPEDLFEPHPEYPGRNHSNGWFSSLTAGQTADPCPGLVFGGEVIDAGNCDEVCHLNSNVYGDHYPVDVNAPHRYGRKNLWYSFQVTGGGQVTVTVYNRTKGKGGIDFFDDNTNDEYINDRGEGPDQQYPFAIYAVDQSLGGYTIDELLAINRFDSTSSGLSLVADNQRRNWLGFCDPSGPSISFNIDPCEGSIPRRYFVMVDNYNSMAINSQVDVGIEFRSVPEDPAQNDEWHQAYTINSSQDNLTPEVLSEGTYEGPWSTYTCATRGEFDQGSCGSKTIWWKFQSDVSGKVLINYDIDTLMTRGNEGGESIVLYREYFDANGQRQLLKMPTYDVNEGGQQWAEGCLTKDTYYVSLSGCFPTALPVRPRILLRPDFGDLCTQPYEVLVDSRDVDYAGSLVIDCHSWGGDFGEDGFTNTGCFFDGSANAFDPDLKDPLAVKSSWFKFRVGDIGKSNLQFNISFQNGSNEFVSENDIKYRVLYGSCDLMTAGECQNTLNQYFTLDCMPPNQDYYVQVISETYVRGAVSISVKATEPVNPDCIAPDLNLVVADFEVANTCQGEPVSFTNLSTQGTSVRYLWDFGDGNISNEVAPVHNYALSNGPVNYDVRLIAYTADYTDADTVEYVVATYPPAYGDISFNYAGYDGSSNVIPVNTPVSFFANASNTSTNPLTTYRWDFGVDSVYETSFDENPDGISFLSTDEGLQIISLTLTTGLCEYTVYDTIQVISGSTASLRFCQGDTLLLDAGAGGLAYAWNTGDSTQTLAVTTAGTYVVNTIFSNGLNTIDTLLVTYAPTTAVSIEGNLTACAGDSIVLRLSGNTAELSTFAWGNGSTDSTITAYASGTYWLQASNSYGCTSYDSVEVIFTEELLVDLGPRDTTLCIGESLELDAGYTGSTYTWNIGDNTQSITVANDGLFVVTVNRPSGCVGTDSISVAFREQLPIDLPDTLHLCQFETAALDAGYDPIVNTILWSTGDSTRSITVDEEGYYGVTVTTASGCSGTDSVYVMKDLTLALSLPADTSICFGNTLNLDAGYSNASYLWSTGDSTQTIEVANAGTYTLTVMTAQGCVGTDSIVVSVNPVPVINLPQDTVEICSNLEPVTISAGEYPLAYTYNWTDSSTTRDIQVNLPGDYGVTVTDLEGCTASALVTVIQIEGIGAVDLGPDTALCSGQTMEIMAVAERSDVAYRWSTGDTTMSIIGEPGNTYWVEISRPGGCYAYDTLTIYEDIYPSIDLGDSLQACANDPLILDAGQGFSTYAWNTGDTTQTLILRSTGDYSVTAVYPNGCSTSGTVHVEVKDPPVFDLLADRTTICQGDTALLYTQLNAAGYQWSTAETTAMIAVTEAGTYRLTVTDDFGCQYTDSITLVTKPVPVFSVGGDKEICPGEEVTVSVDTNLDSLYGTVSYYWSTGETTPRVVLSEAGTYFLAVTTADGCTGFNEFNVTEKLAPAFDLGADVTICSDDSYRIQPAVLGQSYLWNTGATTNYLDVFEAGTYALTVTNVAGCSTTDSINVAFYAEPVFDLGPDRVICEGTAVSLDPGIDGVGYSWSNGSRYKTITVSSSGLYVLTVTSVDGCTYTDSVQVTVENLQLDLGADVEICSGESYLLNVNIAAVNYLWNTGDTTQSIEVSEEGMYQVTAYNAQGCSATDSIYLTVRPLPVFDLGDTVLHCTGDTSVLEVIVVGSYLWSTGETTRTIQVTGEGTYQATATNGFGCAYTDSVAVQELAGPVFDLGADKSICQGESVVITAPIDSVSYLWSTGDTTQSITANAAGVYSLTVTSGNGCSFTDHVTVTTGTCAPDCEAVNVTVTALCSYDPTINRWEIHNQYAVPMELYWNLSTDLTQLQLFMQPGQKTILTLPAKSDTLQTWVFGNLHRETPASVAVCNDFDPNLITVEALCTDNPTTERWWKITNANARSATINWKLSTSADYQQITVAKGAVHYLKTAVADLMIQVSGEAAQTYAGSAMSCATVPDYTGMLLTSVCSDNPNRTRRWRVQNPFAYDILVRYDVYGAGIYGEVLALANADTYFETPTVSGSNTCRIFVNGQLVSTKASSTSQCTFDYTNVALTSICSDNPQRTRRWRVRNPYFYDLPVTWDIYGTSLTGSLIAKAGKDTYFETPTAGSNTCRIFLFGNLHKTKASSGSTCGYVCEVASQTENQVIAEETPPLSESTQAVSVGLYVWPNPAASGTFNLRIEELLPSEATRNADADFIEVYDLHGRKLPMLIQQTEDRVYRLTFPVVADGMYVVRVIMGDHSLYQQIRISR